MVIAFRASTQWNLAMRRKGLPSHRVGVIAFHLKSCIYRIGTIVIIDYIKTRTQSEKFRCTTQLVVLISSRHSVSALLSSNHLTNFRRSGVKRKMARCGWHSQLIVNIFRPQMSCKRTPSKVLVGRRRARYMQLHSPTREIWLIYAVALAMSTEVVPANDRYDPVSDPATSIFHRIRQMG